MGKLRTVRELMTDLGILDAEKDVFREDVFLFLAEHTGSTEQALKLSIPEIQRLSKRFINSDKGTFYFARRGASNHWSHGTSREDVESALPDIIRRWIKNRKDHISKADVAALAKLTRPSVTGNVLAGSCLVREPVYGVARAAEPADDSRVATTTSETEDDALTLPDISHDGQTDASSLPDIDDLVRGQRKRPPRPPSPPKWSATPEPIVVRLSDDEVPLSTLLRKTASRQQRPQDHTLDLRTSPAANPKRKHTDSNTGPERHSNKLPAANSKRPRHIPEDEPLATNANITTGNTRPQATVIHTSPGIRNALHTPVSAQHVGPQALRDGTASAQPGTQHISLSGSGSFIQTLSIQQDALISIPHTVLDYVRKCEKASLNRANAKEITQADRKRHQDKSKLFRDLCADLEPRIVALCSMQTKNEDSGDNHLNAQNESSQPEISSYALWD